MKEILSRKSIKCTLIIIFCAFVITVLHGIVSLFFPVFLPAEQSSIVTKIGFPLTSFFFFVLAFSCIALVFCKYQAKLNGSKIKKGLIFGISFGLIWLWGLIENSVLFGSPLIDDFVTGFVDFLGVFALALMLGWLCFSNNVQKTEKSCGINSKILLVIVFAVVFCIGRYIVYSFDFILSTYQERPYATLIWTLIFGVLIAIKYFMLEDLSKSKLPIRKSFEFGIIIFGLNWLVFCAFIPIFVKISAVELLVRVILDIIVVILSCYVTVSIEKRFVNKKRK